ncbi:hypothetical protein SI859A1_00913 [Aurantimonas manganoxydans SI85-9A1]|uniref:Uncharacterized protein n=1 Tax=Aurantimonas manganoxydans (strain ATCC BAA-1229 / DSM 21871 / SI85-9A1) TaxID=287752 RepID=Q1YJT5_AURMS|nr:hypothetical protein SI859A1_00913 [Aurantimonas manganoxydans SI85-9A1]
MDRLPIDGMDEGVGVEPNPMGDRHHAVGDEPGHCRKAAMTKPRVEIDVGDLDRTVGVRDAVHCDLVGFVIGPVEGQIDDPRPLDLPGSDVILGDDVEIRIRQPGIVLGEALQDLHKLGVAGRPLRLHREEMQRPVGKPDAGIEKMPPTLGFPNVEIRTQLDSDTPGIRPGQRRRQTVHLHGALDMRHDTSHHVDRSRHGTVRRNRSHAAHAADNF